MALTASTMLPLGTKAADFNQPEVVSGKGTSLSTFADKKALYTALLDVLDRNRPELKFRGS